ncbi:transposase, partial [Agrilactobacillus composti]|uniref:transposase n=1 Tax=Agrilactobacillus composti TaxID=398555 RepID=UPI000AD2A82E
MYNLRHNTLKSNTDITIDNAGSEVSSNTGLLLFSEHLYQRGFTDRIKATLKFKELKIYRKYP